jgi:hypothetical protein
VEVARDLDEHCGQLAQALADPSGSAARSRRFIESFVRPRGLDRPVAPIMVEAIEHVAAIRKQPQREPLWHRPAGRALLAALRRRYLKNSPAAPRN